MYILGIETSCDETAAAIIKASDNTKPVTLLSQSIATSLTLHAQTGGIIPESAAREQVKYILPVINKAILDAGITFDMLDAIAVTYGPGLIGSLLVGVETAKTLAYIYKKPLIPVNHMYGHIYVNWLVADGTWDKEKREFTSTSDQPYQLPEFPALALVVSGGHTDLVLLKNHGDLTVLGGTRDDAAGEAFDKIGRLIGLPYPAGPTIAKLAELGNEKAYTLPRPMIGSGDYDFSFSGLKTAVLNLTKTDSAIKAALEEYAESRDQSSKETMQTISNLCASVQYAIVSIIVRKTLKAAAEYRVQSLLLGGGVAANSKLTETLRSEIEKQNLQIILAIPKASLCTDNAAMIAAAGFYNRNLMPWHEIQANPELYY